MPSTVPFSPKPHVIFLTQENPFPPSGGAHLRDSHMIQILRESMDVEVLCFDPKEKLLSDGAPEVPPWAEQSGGAIPEGVRVSRVRRDRDPIWRRAAVELKGLRELRGVRGLRPEMLNDYSHAMERALRERAAPGKLLWISRLGMGKYVELARRLGFKIILDEHQVETHVLWKNFRETTSRLRTSPRGLAGMIVAFQCGFFEGRACRQSDAVVATSDLDASRLLRLAPGAPIHIIPQAIDCSRYAPVRSSQGRTILFSGALNYLPNIEGLGWFVSEVHPRLKAVLGEAVPRLVVAGSNPGPDLFRLLEKTGATIHADPPSLLPYLEEAAVVIIPQRSGRSMRFKILEAMASARAVVSTPRGADGLLLAPGYDIWIADAADRFAGALVRLIENPGPRHEMGLRAARTVEARYDLACVRPLLQGLLEQLGSSLATRALSE